MADLKTTALAGREPEAVVESEYALQRAIYALAALRSGAPSAEIAFCFLERPGGAGHAAATPPPTPRRSQPRCGRRSAGCARPRFTARAGDHCATCPALDRLCPAPGWHGRETA